MTMYVKGFISIIICCISFQGIQAQKKNLAKKFTVKTAAVVFTPKEFGSPASVTDINDIVETNPEYPSLKNLIDANKVIISYADNTFKPKDPLRRGDFAVSFNSALEALMRSAESLGITAQVKNLINTGDQNNTYITSAAEIKDVKESSVYYSAVQSLIEKWGIAAPFTKSKSLNPGAAMTESEVYDVFKTTLGYNSPGSNPYASAMSRSKFAMVLNNALNLKLSQINSLADINKDSLDQVKLQQDALTRQEEKLRRDSLTKEVQLSRIEAKKKEGEAWNKMSAKEKRKQLKIQSTN